MRRLPLALALLIGCGGEPPFPTGEVCTVEPALALSRPPAEDARTAPHSPELMKRWLAEDPSPRRSWSLGRAALLQCPPALDDAVALLAGSSEDAEDACFAAGDRRLARVLSGHTLDALALEDCAGSPTHSWAVSSLVEQLVGTPADEAKDPRYLLRHSPALLLDWIRSPGPATGAALAELSHRGGGADLPERWWEQAPFDDDAAQALASLVAHPPSLPDSTARGREVATEFEHLARRLGVSAAGVPACRALHLAAWSLDVVGHPNAASAWLDARPACTASPWVRVTALERAALRHRYLPASAPSQDELLSQAVDEAREEGLEGPATRLALQLWKGRRRPSMAAAERDALEAMLRDGSRLADDDRLRILEPYLWAAYRSGERSAAAVARDAFVRVATRIDATCQALGAQRWSGFLNDGSEAQLRGLEAAEKSLGECPNPRTLLLTRLTRVDLLFVAGRTAEARSLLPTAQTWEQPLGRKEELALAAAQLDDPDAGSAELERFERLYAAEQRASERDQHETWLASGYHSAIRRQKASQSGGARALELMTRREGLRWFGAPRTIAPSNSSYLGTSVPWQGGLTVATSDAPPRRWHSDGVGALLLDRAIVDGFARLSAADGTPAPSDALSTFAALLPEELSCDPPRALVGIGVGNGVLPPLALLPAGDRLLGSCRATAAWLPSADEPPVVWTRGTAYKATGRKTDPGVFGFDSITASPAISDGGKLGSATDLFAAVDVLHISAHGHTRADGHAVLQLGPGTADILDPAGLGALQLRPGALVTLAACSGAGGEGGDIPPDLPAAAIVAGAGAVLYSRYPVPSVELHEGFARLYAQLPFDCRQLADRWQRIRAEGPRALLAVEVLLSTRCLPSE